MIVNTQPSANLIITNVIATTVAAPAPKTKIFATKYVTKWNFQIRPSGQVDKFCIATILGGLIISIVRADPEAWLKSWNTENAPPIYSTATIPKTDDDMIMYIKNPHTTSAGKFGRLYGRITMVSSIPAETIKYNQDFGVWIREKGLFLDRSKLQTARPKCIGLFDKNFATEAKIPWFTAYLANSITLSRPYQILSHPIYANDGSGLKTFAYQMWSATEDEETLLQEMEAFRNPSFIFLVYDTYIQYDPVEKRKVITKLIKAAKQQTSYVFQGITFDGYMRTKNRKHYQPPTEKENHMSDGDASADDSQVKDATERQHDIAYSNMKCLEFVYNHFVDNKNARIFQRIEGPYKNMFEVTCDIKQRDKVEKIETQFLHVLASRMTALAQDECFTPKMSPTDESTLPKLTQGHARRRATEFSMHQHSEMSYVNAALGGRRNLGLNHDLVTITTLPNHVHNSTPVSSLQTSTAFDSNNSTNNMKALNDSQLAHQQKCDERLQQMEQ